MKRTTGQTKRALAACAAFGLNYKVVCIDGTAHNAIISTLGTIVASLTIRNLDDSVKAALRRRAAQHGHSMEEEAREILRQTLAPTFPGGSLAERIGRRFAGLDAGELPIPPRRPGRRAPQPDEA